MGEKEVLLGEKDLKELASTIVDKKTLVIKEIKFNKEKNIVDIKVSIKKLFSVDANLSLTVKSLEGDIITLEIEKITSLKVDIFSKVQKLIEGRSMSRFKNKGIVIKGKEILVNGKALFRSLNFGEVSLKTVAIEKNALMVAFNEVNEEKLQQFKEIG